MARVAVAGMALALLLSSPVHAQARPSAAVFGHADEAAARAFLDRLEKNGALEGRPTLVEARSDAWVVKVRGFRNAPEAAGFCLDVAFQNCRAEADAGEPAPTAPSAAPRPTVESDRQPTRLGPVTVETRRPASTPVEPLISPDTMRAAGTAVDVEPAPQARATPAATPEPPLATTAEKAPATPARPAGRPMPMGVDPLPGARAAPPAGPVEFVTPRMQQVQTQRPAAAASPARRVPDGIEALRLPVFGMVVGGPKAEADEGFELLEQIAARPPQGLRRGVVVIRKGEGYGVAGFGFDDPIEAVGICGAFMRAGQECRLDDRSWKLTLGPWSSYRTAVRAAVHTGELTGGAARVFILTRETGGMRRFQASVIGMRSEDEATALCGFFKGGIGCRTPERPAGGQGGAPLP